MNLNLNFPLQSLTPKELEIMQYVHDHSDEVTSMSIQTFAKKINYSTSTVIRFCRKIGFSGFPEFKYYLKNLNIQKDSNPVSSDISIESIKNSIKADLESTSSLLNSDDIFQIARLFASNPPIYLYSPAGLTDIAVSYLESMLFISDCQKVYKTTASKALRHFIQTAKKESIFIFISNSGRFESTLNLAKEARLHSMTVISISSIENNDLAEVSNYNLRFFSKKHENDGADLTSRLSSFFVLSSFIEYFSFYKKGLEHENFSESD
ncbi:MurR/RpiR family transcriptional regulator [Anaerostipes faecalis]|uniref:MurR/RpiR family transcriptional regulator n=1 Tax=Anaerostipes faecalis TaxID=2738446 RepID=UPI003F0B3DB6